MVNVMSYYVEEIPVSSKCKEILEKGEHAMFGISPFNSYYCEANITKIIHWAKAKFNDFHLVIPDKLPYYNLTAVGYDSAKALKKTKKQINYLLNMVGRAFVANGISEEERKARTLLMSEFYESPVYRRLYDKCSKRYAEDADFKQRCHNASRVVLQHYTDNVTPTMLDTAAQYLLGELPFYIDTPQLLGVNSSIFVYHEYVEFFATFFKSERYFVGENQGNLALKFHVDEECKADAVVNTIPCACAKESSILQ